MAAPGSPSTCTSTTVGGEPLVDPLTTAGTEGARGVM
jgi:hypothetical protein